MAVLAEALYAIWKLPVDAIPNLSDYYTEWMGRHPRVGQIGLLTLW